MHTIMAEEIRPQPEFLELRPLGLTEHFDTFSSDVIFI